MFHVPVMDLEELVKHKLLPGHKLIAAVQAGLVQEFVKRDRALALIEGFEAADVSAHLDIIAANKRSGAVPAVEVERAVLVLCSTAEFLPSSPSQFFIESVLPIDARFKYTIDGNQSAILLSLSSSRHQLLFEMTFSQKTNIFVSEVMKAAEGVSKRKAPTPEFTWLKPYLNNSASSGSSKPSAAGDHNQNSQQIFTIEGGSPCLVADLIGMSPEGADGGSQTVNSDGGAGGDNFIETGRDVVANRASPSHKGGLGGSLAAEDEADLLRVKDITLDNFALNQSTFYKPAVMPVLAGARESHVQHMMAQRQGSYTHALPLTVFVGTWNVNGVPPSIGLIEWLAVDPEPPDVYALGFQELDLATEAYIFQASNREPEWRAAVLSSLHPAARYVEVKLVRLVGMLLMVLVQEKHAKHVSRVQACTVPTGIMNMLGNKGGVSVSLELYNTSVCFVNCHLAAHVEEYERRNEDYDCICEKTVFVGPSGLQRYIRDHSHIYFFGDMNYRISASPEVNIRKLASAGQYETLLKLDQLNQQRRIGRVFKGYSEGPINFQPTFKYDKDTDSWDSSEKQRQPAWCDRILWAGEGIEQRIYRVHMALKISDHKPVSASFSSQVKVIDQAKYRRVHEEVMKQLDKMENEFLPSVSLSKSEVVLSPVHFLELQSETITISNTGQFPVQFSFIKKLNDEECCKPWLKIHPKSAFIPPGGDCVVRLDVKVDKSSAWVLASGAEQLYDILVLHLDGGKDYFITITGDYVRSCFGSSINALVHLNKPFCEVPVAQLIDLESSAPQKTLELPYAIPKELWYLVDHLHSHALSTEGLFTRPGLSKELCEIRAALDAGMPSRELGVSVHSIAQALLVFLEALPEPVVPCSLYPAALRAAAEGYLPAKQVVSQMPDYHRNVFTYLMAFLNELLVHRHENKLDASTLGSL
ncbi:inositol polyphosphate 5-phosphatase OCRL isoform X2 [Hyalella azteca]|uniref:phosphoinositide 5-phosphatase n=1 Tax=Hyalella azteca TaxID=294128 RepID=A0A979FF90_HYAAZ|nr:inositol polyphosphate 5-phosphatase OCRL isoform X2 [Hyalella azteca]